MLLPDPALTLTVPSIHDGTPLDCRIYHPLNLCSSPWHPQHIAIVAHPYAPLGGSNDDFMVGELAGQLLRRGFVVGTFNFRGAGGSAGRTSWTSKPERGDYMSIVGFLVYYIHHLDGPFRPDDAQSSVLLMAGYSYGAMVTTQLPVLSTILALYASPTSKSEAGQIRNFAETLASQQLSLLQSSSPRAARRVGEAGSPKRSNGRMRSFSLDSAEEKLRRSVDAIHKRRHSRQASLSQVKPTVTTNADITLPTIANLIPLDPAYLLISPLQGLISNLATMSRSGTNIDAASEEKLKHHRTLAIFGDGDVFVPVGKLRSWTRRLQIGEESMFRGEEIQGAGHFWAEEGVLGKLKEEVELFLGDLLLS